MRFRRIRSFIQRFWRRVSFYKFRKRMMKLIYVIAAFMVALFIVATIQLGTYFRIRKDIKAMKTKLYKIDMRMDEIWQQLSHISVSLTPPQDKVNSKDGY